MAADSILRNGPGPSKTFTVTALKRWSVLDKQLPAAEAIKEIHVYDFDNTLFKTPMPNPKLWNSPTVNLLMTPDCFVGGGWWHNARILAATGEGLEKEEPRAWNGWWNDKVVELARLSEKQDDALGILLTGRAEAGYADLIKRMAASKGLNFDMVVLRPRVGPDNENFPSTLAFKQALLQTVMETYKEAREIRIYEDRPKHVDQFVSYMATYNADISRLPPEHRNRGPFQAEVIPVAELPRKLDPVMEVAEILRAINAHNDSVAKDPSQLDKAGRPVARMAMRKNIFFTAYLIDPADTTRLLSLIDLPQETANGDMRHSDVRHFANSIMICPRACPKQTLDRVGGLGAPMTWQVTGTGNLENRIFAASVRPVPDTAPFHTDNPSPVIVLALRKNARPAEVARIREWTPVPADKSFVFTSKVGEKALLRVEPENAPAEGNPYDNASRSLNRAAKRKQGFIESPFSSAKQSGGSGGGGGGGGGGGRQQNGNGPQQRNFSSVAQGGQQAAGRGAINQGRFRGGSNNNNNSTASGHGRGGNGNSGTNRGSSRGQGRGGGPRGGGARGGGGGGRGGSGRGRGGVGGGGAGPGGRPHHHYKSLDDMGPRDKQAGNSQQVSYEEDSQQQQPAQINQAPFFGQMQHQQPPAAASPWFGTPWSQQQQQQK